MLTNPIKDDIVGENIKLCVECLKNYKNLLNDPVKTIQNIFSEYHLKEDFITGAIYRSQIRVIYPILNEYRLYFIEKHYDELENGVVKYNYQKLKELAEKAKLQIPENQKDFKVKDFEFNLLVPVYHKNNIGQFNIKQNNNFNILQRYKEARNKLSHNGFLEFEDSKCLTNPKHVDLKYIVDILNQHVH